MFQLRDDVLGQPVKRIVVARIDVPGADQIIVRAPGKRRRWLKRRRQAPGFRIEEMAQLRKQRVRRDVVFHEWSGEWKNLCAAMQGAPRAKLADFRFYRKLSEPDAG